MCTEARVPCGRRRCWYFRCFGSFKGVCLPEEVCSGEWATKTESRPEGERKLADVPLSWFMAWATRKLWIIIKYAAGSCAGMSSFFFASPSKRDTEVRHFADACASSFRIWGCSGKSHWSYFFLWLIFRLSCHFTNPTTLSENTIGICCRRFCSPWVRVLGSQYIAV